MCKAQMESEPRIILGDTVVYESTSNTSRRIRIQLIEKSRHYLRICFYLLICILLIWANKIQEYCSKSTVGK